MGGELFAHLIRRAVPQLTGGLYTLRAPRGPVTGNPVPHSIPREAQFMADGLIALPLSVKGNGLLPQGVGVSCAGRYSSLVLGLLGLLFTAIESSFFYFYLQVSDYSVSLHQTFG